MFPRYRIWPCPTVWTGESVRREPLMRRWITAGVVLVLAWRDQIHLASLSCRTKSCLPAISASLFVSCIKSPMLAMSSVMTLSMLSPLLQRNLTMKAGGVGVCIRQACSAISSDIFLHACIGFPAASNGDAGPDAVSSYCSMVNV